MIQNKILENNFIGIEESNDLLNILDAIEEPAFDITWNAIERTLEDCYETFYMLRRAAEYCHPMLLENLIGRFISRGVNELIFDKEDIYSIIENNDLETFLEDLEQQFVENYRNWNIFINLKDRTKKQYFLEKLRNIVNPFEAYKVCQSSLVREGLCFTPTDAYCIKSTLILNGPCYKGRMDLARFRNIPMLAISRPAYRHTEYGSKHKSYFANYYSANLIMERYHDV